ncbi:MAG TPA: phosphoesterase [Methanocorpusculum sp.]|jgi:oligoribonuclease NrnB/cAMP/cGMP phosphodiesterase (DHH superfamily)|nr:phosphoesterase [Methanocorpusculum sp.]HJJ61805.1 phosphoesterase [Methanocorpusculum sp.]HJJ62861.1 phosphoesterase [Methanocorpusculum sp.]HJJ68318.1 phosphoesterase [Methanocorpusculum sp.]HJJ73842.1 phosphoesterase [Methanocorpusculum sp.]
MGILRKKKTSAKKQTLQEKIVNRTSNVVHLTHNDLDAAGSDAICRMVFGDELVTLFSSVNRFEWFLAQVAGCNGKGDTLVISDLGYQKGIEDKVRKAHAAGWNIRWFDHHKWTDEEKARVTPYVESLTVDTTRCATGVLCHSLEPKQPYAEEVACVVCDYDLWKHEDKRSAVLGIVTSGSSNLKLIRDKLAQGIIIDDEVSSIFDRIEREKNKCIKKSLRAAKIHDGKYKIAVMPSYGYPSETAAEVRKILGTDIELLVFDNGKFSIRSVPDISHLIAREFNGGGHPNASGGNLGYGWKEKALFKIFRHVSKRKEFLSVAEKF